MYVVTGKGFNSKYWCFLFQEIEMNWKELFSYELSKIQSFWDKMKSSHLQIHVLDLALLYLNIIYTAS